MTKASLIIVQSDGSANLTKVSSPRCAENNGGAADLYLNGKKLASFTQGDKGKPKKVFKNGDGGRLGQAYCCGCVYEHDVTAMVTSSRPKGRGFQGVLAEHNVVVGFLAIDVSLACS